MKKITVLPYYSMPYYSIFQNKFLSNKGTLDFFLIFYQKHFFQILGNSLSFLFFFNILDIFYPIHEISEISNI